MKGCGHVVTIFSVGVITLPFLEFHIIVCGLDSVVARRWMNGMLVSWRSHDLALGPGIVHTNLLTLTTCHYCPFHIGYCTLNIT